MVDDVVVVPVPRSSTEVHTEGLAHLLHLFHVARQTQEFRRELLDVFSYNFLRVSLRIDGDENRLDTTVLWGFIWN